METVLEFARRVTPIVSYRLDPAFLVAFTRFLNFVHNEPTSQLFERWAADSEKWRQRLVDGLTSHTRESLGIAAYHAGRIRFLDDAVVSALQDLPLAHNEGVACGDTTVMNAEYQAFILACRRCLDQMSWALTAALKEDCSSFRRLGKTLRKNRIPEMTVPLTATYDKHERKFHGWLFSREDGKPAIRDDLAHRKSTSAGTLNVSRNGVTFFGMDSPEPRFSERRISDVAESLFLDLHLCVEEMIDDLTASFSSFLVGRYT